MTDNEIIKHLKDYAYAPSQTGLIANIALKLIDRQTAEIERLKSMVEAAEDYLHPLPFKNEHDKEIERVRTKAIKEFAERLKDVFVTIDGTFECFEVEEHIDDLVKEFKEGSDDGKNNF